MIPANAIVDRLSEGRAPIWLVCVTSAVDATVTRTYRLMARTEDEAAMDGIRLFCEETEAVPLGAESFRDIVDAQSCT